MLSVFPGHIGKLLRGFETVKKIIYIFDGGQAGGIISPYIRTLSTPGRRVNSISCPSSNSPL
jgi:hypothetical protein